MILHLTPFHAYWPTAALSNGAAQSGAGAPAFIGWLLNAHGISRRTTPRIIKKTRQSPRWYRDNASGRRDKNKIPGRLSPMSVMHITLRWQAKEGKERAPKYHTINMIHDLWFSSPKNIIVRYYCLDRPPPYNTAILDGTTPYNTGF